jgi:predicted MFS family arabinose efflux permease
LLFYAIGSVLGIFAHTTWMLALARGVQGAGAVSASVTALMADLTRNEVRTRAMAVIGISIGLSFVVALIVAPALDAAVGVPGIFGIMLAMAVLGVVLLHIAVPAEPERTGGAESRQLSGLLEIMNRPQLRPLYFGMFALHAIMTATFISVPQVLEQTLGIASASHWAVYLGVFVASLVGTIPLVLRTERTSTKGAGLFIASVVLVGVAQALLGLDHADYWVVMAALTLFFAVFNFLEARLPALLTLTAPTADRGAALGVFATAQFLGAFFGGVTGGILLGRFGISGVFWGCAVMAFVWALLVFRPSVATPAVVSG